MTLGRTPPLRLQALVQLGALAMSLAVGTQVAVCPPGMEMDGYASAAPSEQPAPNGADMGAFPAHHADCAFSEPPAEDPPAGCPLSVGGVGPCGTTAPAPSLTARPAVPARTVVAARESDGSRHADAPHHVLLPPPRV